MADTLARVTLLEGLGDTALADLRRIATPFAVAAGEVLFRQGDPPSGLFVLDRGLLEIATRMPGDEEARVSRIGPGEVLGEFALLDPAPRSARVVAVEASEGLFLSARSFLAMLEEGREGAVAAIDRLRTLVARRTRATLERLGAANVTGPEELRHVPTGRPGEPLTLDFETVRAIDRFAAFDAAQAAEMLAAGEGLALERGALLMTAGAEASSLALVLRGAIRAAFARAGGLEQVTIHGPGEWAGLVAAIDGGAQPLALYAAEDSLLFRVPLERFSQWRSQPGPVGQAILNGVDRQLVRDQRRANRHLGRAIALERFNAAGREAA